MRISNGDNFSNDFQKRKLLQILAPSSIKIALGIGAWLKEVKGIPGHLINDL
jgi:hypothetical protein